MQKQIKKFIPINLLCSIGLGFSLFGLFLQPVYASYEISDGSIKGLYHQEDTADSSGNGNTLTQSGGSYVAAKFANGYDAGAYASGNNLYYADDYGLTNAFTHCTWFKLASEITTGNYRIMEEAIDNGSNDILINAQYEYNAGTRRLDFELLTSAGYNDFYNVTLGTTWHYLCVRMNNTVTTYWLDGTQVASRSGYTIDRTGVTSRFYINGGSASKGGGITDDAFVANSVFSTTTIQALYNSGTGQEICTTAGCAGGGSSTTTLSTSTDCNIGTDSVDWTLIQKAVEYIFYLLLSVLILSLAIVFLFGFFKRRK